MAQEKHEYQHSHRARLHASLAEDRIQQAFKALLRDKNPDHAAAKAHLVAAIGLLAQAIEVMP